MLFSADRRKRRGPGLTPLIDVVFLLLIFFMLASRFEQESSIPLSVRVATASASNTSSEDVGLRVDVDAQGQLQLDGQPIARAALGEALRGAAGRPVRIRPSAETTLQPIVDVLGIARTAGATRVDLEQPSQVDG